jgi:hypothetical protein
MARVRPNRRSRKENPVELLEAVRTHPKKILEGIYSEVSSRVIRNGGSSQWSLLALKENIIQHFGSNVDVVEKRNLQRGKD